MRKFAQYGCSAVLLGGLCHAASDVRLIDAVKDQNRKAIDSLIGEHVDVNAPQPDGATPLSWAVYLNQVETADRLIAAGAKVNTADEYGETPLTLACGIGNATLIEKLLAAGADANAARWNSETALMIASRSGTVAGVKLLLAHGAKLDAVDSNRGQNALMWAAAEGHSDIVELLIKSGADVKLASHAGFNPLVFAAQKGDTRSVSSLLAVGLSANYALPNGTSVLQVAVLGGKSQVAAVLLKEGANVNIADPAGNTPLHVASQAGNLELVTSLLAKHADPNAKTAKSDATGRQGGGGGGGFRPAGEQTPLLMAARANRESVMRALVAAGADPKAKAQDGTTLLMAAASSGHVEVVKYAYELSPEIDAVTDRKSTVMHASVTGSMQTSTQPEICKVIQFLADKGADLDSVDGRGRTPITLANVLPIDNAVTLLAKLIEASGKAPKQSPKR
jgi:ankyrin repeat protein